MFVQPRGAIGCLGLRPRRTRAPAEDSRSTP